MNVFRDTLERSWAILIVVILVKEMFGFIKRSLTLVSLSLFKLAFL